MNCATQKAKLVAYLKKHWYVTRWQAAMKLGVMNLWARVAELESDGYKFDRRTVTANGKRVMQYWLKRAKAA